MKILVLGSEDRIAEFQLKAVDAEGIEYVKLLQDNSLNLNLTDYEVIFDLNLDEGGDRFYLYKDLDVTVVGSAVKAQLANYIALFPDMVCSLYGMNALPSFINRSKTEVSTLSGQSTDALVTVMDHLGWDMEIVEDRVGMVTPRVIFMIINEAFYTLQEGTAGVKDIDLGMRLGTNYPQGPFEWLDLVGIQHVYETLVALYEDTKDERYKVCPKLKTSYLHGALVD